MNICVFASASPVDEKYLREVEALGFALGKAGHSLVFGGYADGLMKAAADGFVRAGAEVTGVVTELFEDTQVRHPGLTKVILTKDMAARKEEMARISDAFIAVPGGVGTMDELFSVLSLKSVGKIPGPVLFYNIFGFWDGILQAMEKMRAEGFIRDDLRNGYAAASTPEEALGHLSMLD